VQSEPPGCCCCYGAWSQQQQQQQPGQPGQQGQQQQAWRQGSGPHGSSLAAVAEAASSWLSTVGLCAQGLLGGLALLLLLMSYVVFADAPMAGFLRYYAPLALVVNRWAGWMEAGCWRARWPVLPVAAAAPT
jgi:hypothetical protein